LNLSGYKGLEWLVTFRLMILNGSLVRKLSENDRAQFLLLIQSFMQVVRVDNESVESVASVRPASCSRMADSRWHSKLESIRVNCQAGEVFSVRIA
jgi:hypothetical protein